MPTFITIGYGDEAGYKRTPEAVRNAAHRHDDRLVTGGVLMGMAGECVQVRNPEDSGVQRSRGPFMRSDLPIAGFSLVEAGSMEEAVQMVAKSPCAVAHGVVEVWELKVAEPAASADPVAPTPP
jgi:hypothetical protein